MAEERASTARLDLFLAVQHYVHDEKEQLRQSLDKLHGGTNDDGDASVKAKLLPEVLDANIHFSDGDFAGAVARYREAIAKTTSEYQRAVGGRFRLGERRKLDCLSIVLALLHGNLAQALARLEPDSPEVLKAFAKAIELQPGMALLRVYLGNHYASQHLWKQAEAAYRDACASAPTSEKEQSLRVNLANLRCLHAETLRDEEKLGEAIEILEASLRELDATELDGWKGKTYFTLGGIRRRQGRTTDAALAYECSADFYAKSGDRNSASHVTEVLAEVHAAGDDDERALASFEKSYELARGLEGEAKTDRPRAARLKSRIGLFLLLRGRRQEAERSLDESRTLWREEGWFAPFCKILADNGELLKRDEALLRFRLYIQRRLRRAADPAEARDIIDALRRSWDGMLKRFFPSERGPDTVASTTVLPVVTPVAMEIDAAFLRDAGGSDRIVSGVAPQMRNRLRERYGVELPGLRLRANENELPYGTYILMIHEVPLRMGTVEKDHRLHLGDRAGLDRAGIVAAATHPRSVQDKTAFWIEKRQWDKAAAAGLELLEGLELPIRDLEDLLAANLVEFVGHQEVQHLLENAKLYGPDGDSIVATETRAHMDPLTTVVRALVSERVPLTDFARVHSLFRKLWLQQVPSWRITEAIRNDPGIRPHLWGNHASFCHFQLGDRLMATIDASVRGVDETVLALEPEVVQQVLTAVREAVTGCERPAVVVPRCRRRSVMRRLLEIEFPEMPVLAMAELQPGLGARMKGTVEIAPNAAEGKP
jgi:tetratricopeptide (TPR) repeat protein